MHTMLDWFNELCSQLRQKLSSRQRFFNDLRTIAYYQRFDSWDAMHRIDAESPRKSLRRTSVGRAFAIMRIAGSFLACLVFILLTGCGQRPLSFPTPAQRDLIVLVQNGPLTYTTDDTNKALGLEHDLIEAFALELGVGVRYLPVEAGEIQTQLAQGTAHFAAAWLSPGNDDLQKTSPPFLYSHDVLVQHEAFLPVTELSSLKGRTVHVMAGSRQATTLHAMKIKTPGFQVVEYTSGTVFDLLTEVAEREKDMAVVDSALLDIALQFTPSIQATLNLGAGRPIVWLFGRNPNNELLARAAAFISQVQKDGTLARLQDRYLGHVHRLRQEDIAIFIEKTKTTLPKLRSHFRAAQLGSGIDWRLIAALAYHESQWEANATSATGVRGIMMLTEETADRLGVSNRLNARESILAGARYLGFLRDQLPLSTREPDRTWLALTAYNLGLGHLKAARSLARQLNTNPDSWYDMKRILPLLAKPEYYQGLKSGRGRGGEAVILAENIRSYYDILSRHEDAYRITSIRSSKKSGLGHGPAGSVTGRRAELRRR